MPEPTTELTQTIIIELKIGTDPQTEHGHKERAVAIRLRHILKRALRDHGFRCVRIMDGRSPHGPPCPKCSKPTDECRRCWVCFDWICVCGGMTGSALYSMCERCRVDEEQEP